MPKIRLYTSGCVSLYFLNDRIFTTYNNRVAMSQIKYATELIHAVNGGMLNKGD